ncbi:unnamed protein product [Auanema sp. JU1783]|nr:unnamed protein product [Auanema sp. JU1783]
MSGRSREPQKKTKTVAQKTFVFGSSTPRDLSHMNKIPLRLRSYDVKEKHRSAGPPLREYMEKARCLSRNGSADGRNWAFGSSTPRDFSHLTKLDPKFRRYDAVIPKEKGVVTVVGSSVRRSITAPPSNRALQADEPPKPKPTPIEIKKEDDTSSEPDFVQDRAEFLNDLKKEIKEREDREKAQKVDSPSPRMDGIEIPHLHDKRLSVGETSEVSYAQATDLADVVNFNERIPHNFHEEEEKTAKRESVQGLSDQITVSELNETLEDANLSERRDTPPLVQNILKKVESISETSQDEALQLDVSEKIEDGDKSTTDKMESNKSEITPSV